MCTVSYIPNNNQSGFVLTSNRDEKAYRPTVPPAFYDVAEASLVFPKDIKAGGSWIAANRNGRLCCLLNGAYIAHVKKPGYKQSRGKILIEAAASVQTPELYFAGKNLSGVEPFTIVSVEFNKVKITHFNEFIWDGFEKHFRTLNPNQPYIWSSVTLYNKEQRELRRRWFKRFITENRVDLSPEKILGFHSGVHSNNRSLNVVMERENELKTVSITQVVAV